MKNLKPKLLGDYTAVQWCTQCFYLDTNSPSSENVLPFSHSNLWLGRKYGPNFVLKLPHTESITFLILDQLRAYHLLYQPHQCLNSKLFFSSLSTTSPLEEWFFRTIEMSASEAPASLKCSTAASRFFFQLSSPNLHSTWDRSNSISPQKICICDFITVACSAASSAETSACPPIIEDSASVTLVFSFALTVLLSCLHLNLLAH